MSYTPTTWVDGVTLVNAENLNKLEQGVANADKRAMEAVKTVNGVAPDKNGNVEVAGGSGTPSKDGVDCTHEWNGTVLTVTSASGTSSADLKGDKGDDGVSPTVDVSKSGKVTTVSITDKNGTKTATINDGAGGAAGKDGTSVTHSWSGTTLSVTSASGTSSANLKGEKGDKGDTGATGATGPKPVKGTDYWTPADQEAIVQQVITALGTPVFGRVDADNNIILTGELADGTYTLKYEDADGNVTEIGTVTVGEVMPDSGEVDLVWAYGVKLDKTTGVEGSGAGYAASQHIELVDGYTYTFNQVKDSASGNTYGGVNICYYDANGNGLGYEELWGSDANEHSKAITPVSGAVTFRVRLYCGDTGSGKLDYPARYNVTFNKSV